jgi:hypothetical protein
MNTFDTLALRQSEIIYVKNRGPQLEFSKIINLLGMQQAAKGTTHKHYYNGNTITITWSPANA